MDGILEPVSPELVLVTPGLRSLLVERARAEDEGVLRSSKTEEAPPALPERHLPIVVQFALYAGWQAATGALFGFVAFAVFAGLLLLKPFLA